MSTFANIGSGALAGAGAGAPLGPYGALIGALLGGATGYFGGKGKNNLFETGGKETQFDRYTPEQKSLITQLLGGLTGQGQQPMGGLLGNLFGDQEAFEAPYKRQFQEQTIPGLAERFSGLGAGAQSSSAFQQALGGAGADLSERLAYLRSQQQMGMLGPLLGSILQPQQDRYYQPSGPSGFGQLIGQLGGGFAESYGKQLPDIIGNWFKKPPAGGAPS